MAESVKSNLWKLYVTIALRWAMFAMPIIVIFYQSNGLTLRQVFILQAVFALVAVLFEVPTGYFSDRLDRKTAIVIGLVLGFLGYATYAVSYGFISFLVAEILLGIGGSFISGADSALLYDSLIQLGKEGQYKKYEGRLMSVENTAEAAASIAGGFLAVVSLRLPIYFEALAIFCAIPVALTLVEPARAKLLQTGSSLKKMLEVVKFALHDQTEVKWLIFYSAIVSTATLTLVWFIQPYLTVVGVPLALFGVVWAILRFTVAAVSFSAHKIESAWGRKKSLISLIFLASAAYLLLSVFHNIWALSILLMFHFVHGMNDPVLKDYINKLIPSGMRATVLSVKSLIGRLLFAILGPFIGWASDVYSLRAAFFLAGIIFLFLGLIPLLFLSKHKVLSEKST